MSEKDIEKAVDAFRWVCGNHGACKRLDGTKYHSSCFDYDCKEHDYKCRDRICKRLRRFINILKEPDQDSYRINTIDTRTEQEAYDTDTTL